LGHKPAHEPLLAVHCGHAAKLLEETMSLPDDELPKGDGQPKEGDPPEDPDCLKMADNGRQNGDVALLLAIASGQTVRDAAQQAGVSERTAARRMADADFRRQINELRADMVDRTLGKLADSMTSAADKLRELLDADAEQVRLGAARTLLEVGTKLRETVELERRISELEQRARTLGNKKPPHRGA
jgi:hypothetical protein